MQHQPRVDTHRVSRASVILAILLAIGLTAPVTLAMRLIDVPGSELVFHVKLQPVHGGAPHLAIKSEGANDLTLPGGSRTSTPVAQPPPCMDFNATECANVTPVPLGEWTFVDVTVTGVENSSGMRVVFSADYATDAFGWITIDANGHGRAVLIPNHVLYPTFGLQLGARTASGFVYRDFTFPVLPVETPPDPWERYVEPSDGWAQSQFMPTTLGWFYAAADSIPYSTGGPGTSIVWLDTDVSVKRAGNLTSIAGAAGYAMSLEEQSVNVGQTFLDPPASVTGDVGIGGVGLAPGGFTLYINQEASPGDFVFNATIGRHGYPSETNAGLHVYADPATYSLNTLSTGRIFTSDPPTMRARSAAIGLANQGPHVGTFDANITAAPSSNLVIAAARAGLESTGHATLTHDSRDLTWSLTNWEWKTFQQAGACAGEWHMVTSQTLGLSPPGAGIAVFDAIPLSPLASTWLTTNDNCGP